MIFSDETKKVLKNLAMINQSIEFKPGNVLRSMNPNKTIFVKANISEEIPSEACVYDLKKFLSVLELFENPDVEFGDNQFRITHDGREVLYTYTNRSMIITPPEKDISLPKVDVSVDVKWEDLGSVLRAASVLHLDEIAFEGDGEKVYLRAIDTENGNKDVYGVELGETDRKFRLVILRDNLKLIENDYHIDLFSGGISKFGSENIEYFVAIEAKQSSFE